MSSNERPPEAEAVEEPQPFETRPVWVAGSAHLVATRHLHRALLQAQRSIRGVAKRAKNRHQDYQYATADDMAEEARSALNEAGIYLGCISVDYEVGPGGVHGDEDCLRAAITYRLVHAESGEYEDYLSRSPIVPGRGRPQDKAEAAAWTYNLGHFVKGLLLIPRVDEDAEVDNRDDRTYDPPDQGTRITVGGQLDYLEGQGIERTRVLEWLGASDEKKLTRAQVQKLTNAGRRIAREGEDPSIVFGGLVPEAAPEAADQGWEAEAEADLAEVGA